MSASADDSRIACGEVTDDDAFRKIEVHPEVVCEFLVRANEWLVPHALVTPEMLERLTCRPPPSAPVATFAPVPGLKLYSEYDDIKCTGFPPAFAAAVFPNATARRQDGSVFTDVQEQRAISSPNPPAGPLQFHGTLWPWQAKAVEIMERRLRTGRCHGGVLHASCGTGKTAMGFALAAKLGHPMLWLTQAKLVAQTMDRAKQYCDARRNESSSSLNGASSDDCALANALANAVGGGKRKRSTTLELASMTREQAQQRVVPHHDPTCVGTLWRDRRPNAEDQVCIASITTFARLTRDEAQQFLSRFRTVIVDEVHGLPCRTYSRALATLLDPVFRIGLTATIERPNGDPSPISFLTGPVCFRATKTIRAVVHQFMYEPPPFTVLMRRGRPDPNNIVHLVNDARRTDLHAAVLKRASELARGKRILHLSTRTAYIDALKERLGDMAGVVVGAASSASQIQRRAEAMAKPVVLCAFRIGRDGIDQPIFGVGFGLPVQMEGSLTQSVGRTDRDAEGRDDKGPSLVLDFVDNHWLWRKNLNIHNEHWKARGFDVVRHKLQSQADVDEAFAGLAF